MNTKLIIIALFALLSFSSVYSKEDDNIYLDEWEEQSDSDDIFGEGEFASEEGVIAEEEVIYEGIGSEDDLEDDANHFDWDNQMNVPAPTEEKEEEAIIDDIIGEGEDFEGEFINEEIEVDLEWFDEPILSIEEEEENY